MADDGIIRRIALHFSIDEFGEHHHALKAFTGLHPDRGMIVIIGIELEGGLGDEFTFEAEDIHFHGSVDHARYDAVDLAFRDKADERGIDGGGFEIDEVFELPMYTDDEFFEVVGMGVIGDAGDTVDFGFVDGEGAEESVHVTKVFGIQ